MKDILLKYRAGTFEVYDNLTKQLDGHLEISFENGRNQSYAFRPVNGARRPPASTIPDALSIHFGERIVITVESMI